MIDCIEETGKVLNYNNQGIVKYLCNIEEERKNLEIIIQKQYAERKRIETEIEKLTYKLCLINKSLAMRIKAKTNYDRTIEEIKGHYEQLVDSSNKLRIIVEKTQHDLDDIMNKKIGTSSSKVELGPEGDDVNMLYVKSGGDLCPEECPCYVKVDLKPTREKSKSAAKALSVEINPPTSNYDGDSTATTRWSPVTSAAAIHSAMKGSKQTTVIHSSSNKLPNPSGSEGTRPPVQIGSTSNAKKLSSETNSTSQSIKHSIQVGSNSNAIRQASGTSSISQSNKNSVTTGSTTNPTKNPSGMSSNSPANVSLAGSETIRVINPSQTDGNKMPPLLEQPSNSVEDNTPFLVTEGHDMVRPSHDTDYRRKTSLEKSRNLFLASLKAETNVQAKSTTDSKLRVQSDKMPLDVLQGSDIEKYSVNPNEMEKKSLNAILAQGSATNESFISSVSPDDVII